MQMHATISDNYHADQTVLHAFVSTANHFTTPETMGTLPYMHATSQSRRASLQSQVQVLRQCYRVHRQ
jgi:hypothetical protein